MQGAEGFAGAAEVGVEIAGLGQGVGEEGFG